MTANPIPVVRWARPRSAHRPAREAPSAPTAPARPNRPTFVVESSYGDVLSASAIGVMRTTNAAKISAREGRPDAQDGELGVEPRERPDQLGIGDSLAWRQVAPGQHLRQDHGHDERGGGGDDVHRAPASEVRDRARHRTGEQDPEDDAARDRSDYSATIRRVGQSRGVGHQQLGDNREQTHDRHAGEQDAGSRRGRDSSEGEDREQRLPHDQAPAVEAVAEWDEADEAEAVADLRDRSDQADRRLAPPEVAADGLEQRLERVRVRDSQPTGDGEHHGQPWAESGRTQHHNPLVSNCNHRSLARCGFTLQPLG